MPWPRSRRRHNHQVGFPLLSGVRDSPELPPFDWPISSAFMTGFPLLSGGTRQGSRPQVSPPSTAAPRPPRNEARAHPSSASVNSTPPPPGSASNSSNRHSLHPLLTHLSSALRSACPCSSPPSTPPWYPLNCMQRHHNPTPSTPPPSPIPPASLCRHHARAPVRANLRSPVNPIASQSPAESPPCVLSTIKIPLLSLIDAEIEFYWIDLLSWDQEIQSGSLIFGENLLCLGRKFF